MCYTFPSPLIYSNKSSPPKKHRTNHPGRSTGVFKELVADVVAVNETLVVAEDEAVDVNELVADDDADVVAVELSEVVPVVDCDVVAVLLTVLLPELDCVVVALLLAEVVADVEAVVVTDDDSVVVALLDAVDVRELVRVEVAVVDGDVCSQTRPYETLACLCSIAALRSLMPSSQPVFHVSFPPKKQPNGS